MVEEAESIETQLVRFTDLHARRVSDDGGESPLIHKRVVAWVVTLRGVCALRLHGPIQLTPSPTPLPSCSGTEWNIVLDASTGELIEIFSYR